MREAINEHKSVKDTSYNDLRNMDDYDAISSAHNLD